jgi:integrase/recombinase XerD
MNKWLSFYIQRYFLSYMVTQHNYGENTITSYRDTFRLLLTYLKESIDISKIKVEDLDQEKIITFLDWLRRERGNGISTRNVRFAHIKSFCRFLLISAPEYADLCSKILSIPFAKEIKKPPSCFSEESVKSLLAAVNAATKEGLRHLALIVLLYDSGCRVQEVIDLSVADFQAGNCSRIYVRGKGNKFRTIPLLGNTEKILSRYIRLYQLEPASPLFFNRSGGRLTRQGVRHILRKYSEMVNEQSTTKIEEPIHPHKLRHSKATHLVNAGVNLYNIRDFLGHESVTTTQIYLTSNPETTRKAIESAAAITVPNSLKFFSAKEKDDLLSFLDSLA